MQAICWYINMPMIYLITIFCWEVYQKVFSHILFLAAVFITGTLKLSLFLSYLAFSCITSLLLEIFLYTIFLNRRIFRPNSIETSIYFLLFLPFSNAVHYLCCCEHTIYQKHFLLN